MLTLASSVNKALRTLRYDERVTTARQEQDQARRERIARVAFELFARTGLEATRVQDIASAAYVSRTNLYRYFPSKTHMLLAHFEHALSVTRQDALRCLSNGSTPQVVWHLIATRMADLGMRYQHLVGAVGQAVLGSQSHLDLAADKERLLRLPIGVQQELKTASALVGTLEPVFSAMKTRGYVAIQVDTQFVATLYVDSCLLSLMHGGWTNKNEVLGDWEDRLDLLMNGFWTRS